jgi:hypothetical protein
MLNYFIKLTLASKPILLGFVALALMLAISFDLRQQDFKPGVGAQNLEATYHALLTINALNESPATNHWYLPTVTLGRDGDKGIPWGATVPTETGDYIYTSFTPLGFLAPYAAFNILNVQPSVKNLARFNFVLGCTVSVVLFILLWHVLNFIGYRPWVSVGGALIGVAIGIFSREALQSHGIIYWSQSLYQLSLVACLWFVFKYLSIDGDQSKNQTKYALAIVVAAFVGALTEWTGYIFNFGLAYLFWVGVGGMGRSKSLSIWLLLATTLVGFVTLIHYGLALGFKPAMAAFLGRFLARNTSSGNLVGLIQGYGLSFGLFLIVLMIALSIYYFANSRQQTADSRQQTLFFIFTAASMPLLENIVMLQHATQFSFDRLKFIFPAALILAVSFCRQNIKWRVFLGVLVILSCVQGYISYKDDLRVYSTWRDIDARNNKLAIKIASNVDITCTVFLSNLGVRGYSNDLFRRGIYEAKSPQESTALMAARNGCAAVYLEGVWAFPDLPRYTKATITYKNGSTQAIDHED